MFVSSVLDEGFRGIAQAIALAAGVLVSVLVVALCVPVVVLFGLTHPSVSGLSQSANTSPTPGGVTGGSQTSLVSTSQAEAVQVAQRYLGIPYVFGGTNPAIGLDCSGLVQLVFQQIGIKLPRTAQQQYDATVHVDRDQLQPGDLVFFAHTYADPNDWITHVGIYIGNGQQINAPTEGQRVSVQPVFTGFWGAHFVSGGRVGAH